MTEFQQFAQLPTATQIAIVIAIGAFACIAVHGFYKWMRGQ